MGATKCWSCANACGGCSWSATGTPVNGWTATPTKVGVPGPMQIDSYFITDCPEFMPETFKHIKHVDPEGYKALILMVVKIAVKDYKFFGPGGKAALKKWILNELPKLCDIDGNYLLRKLEEAEA